jgi:starvation-inducible DNA-binding protein
MGKSDTADLEISVKGSSEPTADLGRDGVAEIGVTLRHLLADVFALHMKTKNFHWHRSGVHFRDHYLLLDERLKDSDEESLGPKAMLTELRTDNRELPRFLRMAREVCEEHSDVATASLIENWIDETERADVVFVRNITRSLSGPALCSDFRLA